VNDLGEGSKAVGGARGVGHDGVLGVVRLKVDTTDEHGGVGRRSGDDDLLGSTLQVSRGLVLQSDEKEMTDRSAAVHQDQPRARRGGTYDGGEDTGGLDNVVSSGSSPLDGSRVSLSVNGDGLALDNELAVLDLDGTLEDAVGRVVPGWVQEKKDRSSARARSREETRKERYWLEHVDHVLKVDERAAQEEDKLR
jgi:hypothetical protein